MIKAKILPADPSSEFFIDEGCFILENSNSLDDPDCSVARARVLPHSRTAWHRLEGITERYVVVAGSGMVEVGDLPPTRVEVGAVVVIPPGVRQRIENVGDEDLIFYCICTPRFLAERYVGLE